MNKEELIAEINKEIESINNIAIMRFVLYTVQAFKKKDGGAC